jgi:hypothetical protein
MKWIFNIWSKYDRIREPWRFLVFIIPVSILIYLLTWGSIITFISWLLLLFAVITRMLYFWTKRDNLRPRDLPESFNDHHPELQEHEVFTMNVTPHEFLEINLSKPYWIDHLRLGLVAYNNQGKPVPQYRPMFATYRRGRR